MANTTNFGWETPDDTDLVKDGALAMRTLGNAIDTSLVDLKGGTTNQVLAKNSNTDMDFKWVADASGIPATIIDAKGDLIAGTAADTAGRLPVGANDLVLTAASGETTGLKWSADWTTFTPSWTNFTLGNGTVTNARYLQVGKLVNVHCEVALGSTSSVTGAIRLDLPVTAKNTETWLPAGMFQDVSPSALVFVYGYLFSTTAIQFYVLDSSVTYAKFTATSSTIPFTWTTGDYLWIDFSYGAA